MKTLTWEEVIDTVSDKIEEFETRQDWFEFDMSKFLREQGACGADITTVNKHFLEFRDEMDKEYRNDFPEDLFTL